MIRRDETRTVSDGRYLCEVVKPFLSCCLCIGRQTELNILRLGKILRYVIDHVYLLVSSYWVLLHLKRTPQSLSPDRKKGTAKIQTKDTSKRIDVFLPCMISLLKT